MAVGSAGGAAGDQLKHPISLDVFESSIYWITRDSGELVKQDKFGRGVPVIISKDLVNPSGIKVYHKLRYNTTVSDACVRAPCSHLCLAVPGGRRCACPDSQQQQPTPPKRNTQEIVCDAAVERPRPSPRVCPCQNGGWCVEGIPDTSDAGSNVACACPPPLSGAVCEHGVAGAAGGMATSNSAAVIVPIVVVLLLVLVAGAAWLFIRKRPFGKGSGLGSLASSQSVSFRQGSNVEFGGAALTPPPPTATETLETSYGLEEVGPRKGRDFSNPMYEAVTRGGNGSGVIGIYEVPDEIKGKVESAVLSPSSTETRGAAGLIGGVTTGGKVGGKQRQLDPVAVDTGKDTQSLVHEDKDC